MDHLNTFKDSYLSNIEKLFIICCHLVTFCLTIYCIHRYIKNEDSTEVKYTDFYSDHDSIYPSMSFCFRDPFIEEKFISYGLGFNISIYQEFLKGKFWDERMLNITYDKVTFSLEENILGGYAQIHKKDKFEWKPYFYVSFRSAYQKCFAIDQPTVDREYIFRSGLIIKKSIFPAVLSSQNYLLLFFVHYPGQRLIAKQALKFRGDDTNRNFALRFIIKDMDVITRRNKYDENCIEDWRRYDEEIMEKIIVDTNCRPPHWVSNLNLPLCTKSSEMKRFAIATNLASNKYERPCRSIARLTTIFSKEGEEFIDKRVFEQFSR